MWFVRREAWLLVLLCGKGEPYLDQAVHAASVYHAAAALSCCRLPTSKQGPPRPPPPGFEGAESPGARLHSLLDGFEAAPFTLQRLCEVLLEPRKQYARLDKVVRAETDACKGWHAVRLVVRSVATCVLRSRRGWGHDMRQHYLLQPLGGIFQETMRRSLPTAAHTQLSRRRLPLRSC